MTKTNEVLLKDREQWLHFTDPYQIISVQEVNKVVPSLREIEKLVEVNGWHAAGFISYEAAPAFDSAFHVSPYLETGFPLLWFGLYPQPPVILLPEPVSADETLNWLLTVDRDSYHAAIKEIKSRIAEGRTYQVNYTTRLQTDFTSSAWDFFLHFAQTQNNHAAYVDTGRYAICSASPELFFQLDGNRITCRPMKGTAQRGRTTLEDLKQSKWLRNSEKNQAENVMIVDMVRNDLGRIAEIGTVQVPELFNVERYPTLWQMTSTVTAKTKASLTDIFTALFPSASITGAPRVSTMKIIAELEAAPRRIYTGSIGYIAPNRRAKFNVAIRTALVDRESQKAEYGLGGGIVWDSTSADEYEEALLKARVLTERQIEFSLLETILWTPEEGFFLRERHIARLMDSAKYFDFRVSKEKVDRALNTIASGLTTSQRLRLLLDKEGNIKIEFQPYQSTGSQLQVCLASKPIDSEDVFLFHKTTNREVYAQARKCHSDYDDVLLHNERGELTEFTIGNLVVELGGQLFTPPISCGVLSGTFRAHLLEIGQVMERTIRVEELKDCTKMFLVNSVRKWQRVKIAEAEGPI